MKLTLQRLFFTERSTCGELFVENRPQRFCYTRELPVVDGLPGLAIPPGEYPIELAPSPKFLSSTDEWVMRYARLMPHIVVPNRSLIMIHWGNVVENTDGCILVGATHDLDEVGESRAAFSALFPLFLDSDVNTIDIQGGLPYTASWPNE